MRKYSIINSNQFIQFNWITIKSNLIKILIELTTWVNIQ